MSEIELTNEYVSKITGRVIVHLDNFYEDKFDFIDEDGNVTMEEDDVEICLERVLEDDDMSEAIGTERFETLLDKLWELHRDKILSKRSEIEDEIQDQVNDYNLYRKLGHRAYYHYIYGLSEKDFM